MRTQLFTEALASNLSWGFESLAVILKSEAKKMITNADWDNASETEIANANKLIDQDNTLTYILGWTAPSNSGSSIIIADIATCKQTESVTVSSEE